MPKFTGTPDVEVVLDGPDKPFEHVCMVDGKRKTGGLMEGEISVFTSMTEVVKEVATVIKDRKSLDIHPDLHGVVMEQGGFSDVALMATLSHLLDNKAHGVGFVTMADAHWVLWLRSWLGKHYY
ncbi:Translational activator GCN1 [Hordeum vulgare]|nr:Translational activator GCN1 [Hordeum vulgare]